MADLTALTYNDLPGPLPASYTMKQAEVVRLSSVAAEYDGTSASTSFLPCFSVYSQDGKLIGRWTASEIVSPGDTARVTFSVDGHGASVEAAYSQYEVVAAATNNAASIKATPGKVHGWYCYNASAAARYVKLYNKASAPSPGSDTPKWVIALPAGAAANVLDARGLDFPTGIGIAIVQGIANNDNTAVAASDVVASIAYV